tara:strand:+ start:15164 stop:15796 length:633 start_codon:yes stop_codon:yes gene_type:complete
MVSFIDIETKPMCEDDLHRSMPTFRPAANIKDPTKQQANIQAKQVSYIEKAALSPTSGTIQTIGVVDGAGDYQLFDTASRCEKDMLQDFWDYFQPTGTTLVGWNILNFDLPFMIHRSWALGVKPTILQRDIGYNRYRCEVLDLMQYMCLSKDQRQLSLSKALQLLGLAPKCDLDGLLPYEIYDRCEKTYYNYLKRDVEALVDIYDRIILY